MTGPELYTDLFGSANSCRDHSVTAATGESAPRPSDREFDEKVRRLVMEIWPGRSFVPALALIADITVRQAQRIMAREQGFSFAVYAELLRSKHGDRFLRLLMNGSDAEWWREVGHEREIAALKKQRRALEKQIERLSQNEN